jgi:hypothetical protein
MSGAPRWRAHDTTGTERIAFERSWGRTKIRSPSRRGRCAGRGRKGRRYFRYATDAPTRAGIDPYRQLIDLKMRNICRTCRRAKV